MTTKEEILTIIKGETAAPNEKGGRGYGDF